jgi:nucleoside-diphosphate-sugar epimerase
MENGREICVTGAGGFVGKVLCRKLVQNGHDVCVALHHGEEWTKLREEVPGVKRCLVIGDLGKSPSVSKGLEGVEVIVHLAARVHRMREDIADPLGEYRRTNVDGTMQLAQAAVAQGVRRLVFLSTVKVNGEASSGMPFTEEDKANPRDPYAISKWEAEEGLRRLALNDGLEVVIVRPPLVYGPGVKANFLRLMQLVARQVPLPLPNPGKRRSLIGVENLADFIVRCVSHPDAANQMFFVSDGEDISMRDLVVRLAGFLGCSPRVITVPELILRLGGRLAGRGNVIERLTGELVISSEKARQRLGWQPANTLNEGVAATVSWYLAMSGEASGR